MSNSFFSKKRYVEIYFILYLAALMLLIPDLKEKTKNTSKENFATDNSLFRIFPDKTVLNTRISLDSLGMQSVNSDSMNTIYYFGNVKKIDFDFQIENKALNQVININQASNIWNYFKFKESPELRAVLFFWKPPLLDNRNYVYNVLVSAKADIEVYDQNLKKNVLRKLNSTTQFSLVVNYYDNQTGLLIASKIDSTSLPNSSQSFTGNYINTGEIFMDLESKRINNLATEEWTNKITIWGMNLNNDLGSKPEIKIINSPENNTGSAYIKHSSNNSLIIAGNTPQYGSSRIKIKLTRKSDKSVIENEFVVYPIPLLEPNFPSIMYPQQVYKFEPNLPEISDKYYLVKIVSDSKVLFNSFNSNSFNFIIDDNYVGKTIYFERYINGNIYGKSYPILIKQYPSPQIARIQNIGSKKVKIIINTFGFFNGSENYIRNIELTGNGVYNEIIGQSSVNKQNYMITQVYEVWAKNEQAPFEFKIRVQDLRGNWSSSESYP